MEKYTTPSLLSSFYFFFFFFFIVSSIFLHDNGAIVDATTYQATGSEAWGYVEVRPKAHMFWWYYKSPNRSKNPTKTWPLILWLQGGPGASGVGIGNFEEIGPLDTNLNPRNTTWLSIADLLFVDNPVGTGYSYVEDINLFVRTDEAAAVDLTTLLVEILNTKNVPGIEKSPLYIVAESYGGKFAVTLALSLLKAINSGKLNIKLGGVALGNSWISPVDFVSSWGPLLKDVSRFDDNGLEKSNKLAELIKQQITKELFENATNSWIDLENLVTTYSNSVDFYNFLQDESNSSPASLSSLELKQSVVMKQYSTYLESKRSPQVGAGGGGDLVSLMNGVIKKKLQIPDNIQWGGQSGLVFQALSGDFMKPRIAEVDELLAKGVNVTVYNGQIDLICCTKGVEAWVEKLRWDGLTNFKSQNRSALYCDNIQGTKGFLKSYRNFHFYWILGAGHFVPVDQPCVTLDMIAAITQSPAASTSKHTTR